MNSRMIIAESNDLLRQGLRMMIEARSEWRVVAEARDCQEAVAAATAHRTDVVLMDLAIPGLSGIDATRRIKDRSPQVRVIAFTERKSIDYVRGALRAGVDAYVLKTASLEEVLMAIGHVLTGKKFLSPELSSELVEGFLVKGARSEFRSSVERLTSSERRVLTLVAEGCTSQGAAELLHISRRTVEKQRAQMMRKLGLKGVAEVVLFAMDAGLVKRPELGARPVTGPGSAARQRRAVTADRAKAGAAR